MNDEPRSLKKKALIVGLLSVKDNWWVKPGQVLVRLDTADAEVRLADARATLQKAKDTVDQLFVAVDVAEERIKETKAEMAAAQAQLATAQAEFHQAELDFKRAQQLLQSVYIEANYKETQLTDVRVGQPGEIRADIYPGRVYHGKVESLSAGAGAAFSLLPPENATGNWVKVVQRVPVKVVFNRPPPVERSLRIGLSVEATIDATNRDGALLTSLLQLERMEKDFQPPTDGGEKRNRDGWSPQLQEGVAAIR